MFDSNDDGAELNYIAFNDEDPQDQSPLFQLPGEIRDNIYYYALTSYEDTSQPYDVNTYWFRPQYFAPRRSDTSLLRCCKRIYNEGWYLPWTTAEHTFWLTGHDRAPEQRMSKESFSRALDKVQSMHGEVDVGHVRFFAQLYILEPGPTLSEFLDLPNFHPKCITVTLRHTDWWFWENDYPLSIQSPWVNRCRLPASVDHFKMELESLQRKKPQIDSIAEQMKEKWVFFRSDGVRLSARHTEVDVLNWKGSSTWNGQRWIRDETEADVLEYYIATVTWRNEHAPASSYLAPGMILSLDNEAHQEQSTASEEWLSVKDLEDAQVPGGTPASEALALVQSYREAQSAREREGISALGGRIANVFGRLIHRSPAQ